MPDPTTSERIKTPVTVVSYTHAEFCYLIDAEVELIADGMSEPVAREVANAINSREAFRELILAARAADEVLATWFSAEYNSSDVHARLSKALAAANGGPR